MNTMQSIIGPAGIRRVYLVTGLLALMAAWGFAQSTNAPEGPDYSSFKVITDRNIFDPNRYPHSAGGGRHESRHAPPVDSFSLTGTMIYQKGRFAFFDGTHPDYRQILGPGGTVAGYQVQEISPGSVLLVSTGKRIELKVGAQMRREEDGTWRPVQTEEQMPQTPAENTDGSTADSTGTGESTGPDPSIEGNDVLKKLMQQREQEMK